MRGPAGERVAGKEYTAAELAEILNKQAGILHSNEGGITFSGGEPLLQSEFVAAVIDLLQGQDVLLDTSGYAGERDFRRVAQRSNMILFDLKLMDGELHRRYTGCANDPILHNLQVMSTLRIPFVIRDPLVPGVTDTDENLAAIAKTVRHVPGLLRVDLLPYNKAAGAKYASAGLEFKPDYDETRELSINTVPFQQAGVPVRVV